jgi:hypothetical protein
MVVSVLLPATMILRHDERTKLVAATVEKLAIAISVGGYIAPVISGSSPGNVQSAVTLLWLFLGRTVWCVAYLVVGRLL